jgi:hypothetical protein
MKTENAAARAAQTGNGGENAGKNGATAGMSGANALNESPYSGWTNVVNSRNVMCNRA